MPAVAAVDDEANGDADDDADECDDHHRKRSVLVRYNLLRRRRLLYLHLLWKNWLCLWNSVVSGATEDIVSEGADYSPVRKLIDTCYPNLLAKIYIVLVLR